MASYSPAFQPPIRSTGLFGQGTCHARLPTRQRRKGYITSHGTLPPHCCKG